jgi:hypothetical protein
LGDNDEPEQGNTPEEAHSRHPGARKFLPHRHHQGRPVRSDAGEKTENIGNSLKLVAFSSSPSIFPPTKFVTQQKQSEDHASVRSWNRFPVPSVSVVEVTAAGTYSPLPFLGEKIKFFTSVHSGCDGTLTTDAVPSPCPSERYGPSLEPSVSGRFSLSFKPLGARIAAVFALQ